jgi:hypothetical protein
MHGKRRRGMLRLQFGFVRSQFMKYNLHHVSSSFFRLSIANFFVASVCSSRYLRRKSFIRRLSLARMCINPEVVNLETFYGPLRYVVFVLR